MIYLFTHSYPYARRGEVFLRDEMLSARALGLGGRIRFVPLCREPGVDTPVAIGVPAGSEVSEVSEAFEAPLLNSLWRRICLLASMLWQARFWRIPTDFNPTLPRTVCLRQGVKYFYAGWAYADWIRRHRHRLQPGDILYSYWAHYNVLGMALAREKGWLPAGVRCVSRGHRYDIYEETAGRYFPYRRFSLAVLDALYPCSRYGADFIKARYPELADRIHTAYLGVRPLGADDVARRQALRPPQGICRVVSCALVSPVKRLPLLMRSLAAFAKRLPSDTVLEWHHFGGGAGLSALQAEAALLAAAGPVAGSSSAARFRVVWHGQTDNACLRETYLNTYFHAFVHVSESEGLPVSFMEAFAAGIPVVATDVGGSGELVRAGGGRLLQKDFTQAEFDAALQAVLRDGDAARETAYAGYQACFSSENNYAAFYGRLFGENA